jgi:hypothetical protein
MSSCSICAEVKFYIAMMPVGCVNLKDGILKEKIIK